jgi:hypothetical protein
MPSEEFNEFVEHYRTLLSFYMNVGVDESIIAAGVDFLKQLEGPDDGEGDVDPTPL